MAEAAANESNETNTPKKIEISNAINVKKIAINANPVKHTM